MKTRRGRLRGGVRCRDPGPDPVVCSGASTWPDFRRRSRRRRPADPPASNSALAYVRGPADQYLFMVSNRPPPAGDFRERHGSSRRIVRALDTWARSPTRSWSGRSVPTSWSTATSSPTSCTRSTMPSAPTSRPGPSAGSSPTRGPRRRRCSSCSATGVASAAGADPASPYTPCTSCSSADADRSPAPAAVTRRRAPGKHARQSCTGLSPVVRRRPLGPRPRRRDPGVADERFARRAADDHRSRPGARARHRVPGRPGGAGSAATATQRAAAPAVPGEGTFTVRRSVGSGCW